MKERKEQIQETYNSAGMQGIIAMQVWSGLFESCGPLLFIISLAFFNI